MVRQGWLLFFVLLPLTILASTPNQQPTPYTPPEAWAKRLQDPNADVRREAVIHLVDSQHPRLMEWLLPMLEDPDAAVCDHTRRFFTVIGQPDDERLLAMASAEDPAQRRRAVLALGAVQQRSIGTSAYPRLHLPILYQALLDPDAGVRQAADRAFEVVRGRSSGSENVLPVFRQLHGTRRRDWVNLDLGWPGETDLAAVLLKGIASPDPATQRWAAWLLGWTHDPRAEQPLIDLLKAPVPAARLGAAEGLGRFQQTSVVDPLLGALADADPQVREQAARSLAWLRQDAGPEVQAALAGRQAAQRLVPLIFDLEQAVQIAAARSLGILADPATAAPLIVLATTEKSPLIYELLNALGKIGNPEAIPVLAEKLKDPVTLIRYTAIDALADIDDPRSADLLLALLNDPSKEVRRKTVYEIARRRVMDPRLAQPLIEVALHGETKDVRSFAIEALGRFGGPDTTRALITLIQDTDLSGDAASSLARLHDPTVIDPLIALLPEMRYPWTQASVVGVLGVMGNRKAIPAILPCLGAKAPVLRHAAARALNQLTGESYGEDQARWQAWWEAHTNE
ncbi:MAG: HEAT repeat domain-containing protein [Armatimonadota bacterium]